MLGVRPVLVRELRTLARQRSFYGIRVAAGAVALGLLGYIWLTLRLPPTLFGAAVFTCMANLLFCAIWVVGPLISSDCISSEKREGTLPLLFLTPLRPGEIILAKLGAQLLRTGTLLLAVIPVLVIPLLFGGVTWMDVARAILLNVSALLISLTIGAFASTLTKRRAFGTVLAFLLSIGTSVNFVAAYLVVRSGVWGGKHRSFEGAFEAMANMLSHPAAIFSMIENKLATFSVVFGLNSYAAVDPMFAQAIVSRSFSRASVTSVQVSGLLLFLSILGILFIHLVATFQLRRFWREHPASPAVEKAKRVLFKPLLFESGLRKFRRGLLTRNPVLGISLLSVGNRLHKWWWLLGLVVWVGIGLRDFESSLVLFGGLVLFAIGYGASSCFQFERDSGVLELLLVTGLSPRSVVAGKLLGLLGHYWLMIIALFAIPFYIGFAPSSRVLPQVLTTTYSMLLFVTSCYLVAGFGYWISLTKLHPLAASAVVGGTGVMIGQILPHFLVSAFDRYHLFSMVSNGWTLVFNVRVIRMDRNWLVDLTFWKCCLLFVILLVPFLIGSWFLRRHCRDLGERRFVSG